MYLSPLTSKFPTVLTRLVFPPQILRHCPRATLGFAPNSRFRTAMGSQLPHLQQVERLTPDIIRILGANPGKFTLQGSNTYLVGRGPSRILIDTAQGEPEWLNLLASTLTRESATVSTVLLTHWHADHIGGIPDLLASNVAKDPQIFKNDPQFLGHGDNATRMTSLAREGKMKHDQWQAIHDGDSFQVPGANGVRLKAIHSPGHTTDHMSFAIDQDGKVAGLFTGDNVLGHGTAVFEDLKAYMDSLKRMGTEFDSGTAPMYPGHGAVIQDGRSKIIEYSEHRKQRERQILDVMGSQDGHKDWTSMDIVKVVYKDVPENLHIPAEGGVRQVLEKLKTEGTIENESDRWRLKGGDASL